MVATLMSLGKLRAAKQFRPLARALRSGTTNLDRLNLGYNPVSDSAAHNFFASMRQEDPVHTSVSQRLLGRIYPAKQAQCSQTNQLSDLNIAGISKVSSGTLDVLCESLSCFDDLDIAGVGAQHQGGTLLARGAVGGHLP